MTEEKRDSNKRLQEFIRKALKATIKGVLFYGIYFVLSMFLAPVPEIVPGFQQMIEVFVMVYIFLMIIGELTAGTIFHHFFNGTKALFVILYLVFSLNGGIVGTTVQNVNLIIDLRLFLAVAMLLGLLGFAKSVLQAINFLNEKTEHVHF
ncbi:MAG: hypothetical protein NWE85_06140 [Candidatus Bathyarchaeota archaeon]|nr:hypothetical protein [Candidatus Bathyarchaeota archaeon]